MARSQQSKIITTIKVSLQKYNYFNYKHSSKQFLYKKEETFLEVLIYEQDNNIQINIKKVLLKTLECGTTDYRIEKIQNKLIQESLGKEITNKSIINLQQSSNIIPIEETENIQETSN
ncbi:25998_t:CDS:1 [Gigaspora margarita]|uniref:25998_t:CDS:1 n=1 Tax=Gigaspora margarita TaxID=4874 RepID=A0ABN7UZ47_GIGMA|nr:25998_t:CDS:1 [Gigaspora margarita]